MASRIRKGDTVVVVRGRDGQSNKTGKVLKVLKDEDRVLVEGVNRVWKHVKPSQRYPQGGRIQKEAPIHVSNVMVLDPSTNKPTRIRYEIREGVKHRIAAASGTDLGPVGPKKEQPAEQSQE